MKIRKLLDIRERSIRYGSVFRVLGKWPYEPLVDFLLVYSPGCDRKSNLVVSTGHKAGLIMERLPLESSLEHGANGISTKWAISNWDEWIYPDCPIEDVFVID
ncbi:Imm45 family immunity protein [Cupriavidus agavae]